MASLPNNNFVQVQTYQDGALAYLQNYGCFISTANTKFKDFDKTAINNLGSSVTFSLPYRYTTTASLVANFQPTTMRSQTLTVDQALNVSVDFSAQQFVFTMREYMDDVGKGATEELANAIEANIALNAISGVVNNDNTSASYGLPNSNSGPFRFFGDGVNPINSFGQLAQAFADFRDFGCPKDKLRCYLPLAVEPQIVNSGLNQFVLKRNEEEANSWEIGSWSGINFYRSNLLPTQIAGNCGNLSQTLTLISTNDPTGAAVTQLTLSGASASDVNAINYGDVAEFTDGVSGFADMRFLTFIGHSPSQQPVQFRATAAAASNGSGNVTVNIYPALCSVPGNANQNLNQSLQPGMQVSFMASHRAGLIVSGDALMLAMPQLPDESPYPTGNKVDPETGVSMRVYHGSLFGQNQRGMIHDAIWGSTGVPEYMMRILFPMNQ